MLLTSFAASMAVDILVTALIVFKFLMHVKADRTALCSETTKLRSIIFVTIESSIALFAIQLVRIVLYNLPVQSVPSINGVNLVIAINQMFNVIIRSVHFYFFCSTDNILPG